MKNERDQMVEKDNETVTSTQGKTQRAFTSTGRPNIDVITARNEEEVKQDRKLSYKIVGISALFVMAIIIVIYFFS